MKHRTPLQRRLHFEWQTAIVCNVPCHARPAVASRVYRDYIEAMPGRLNGFRYVWLAWLKQEEESKRVSTQEEINAGLKAIGYP